MAFSDQSRYNNMFQKMVHKGEESEINYIKIFRNYKALEISVGNSYTEDHIINTLLGNFHKGVN